MKSTTLEFMGQTYQLSFTAQALFAVYDGYGVTDDILAATGAFEATSDGFYNLCFLTALMASQGELQRRWRGEDPRDMLTLEAIRTNASPADVIRIRAAVRAALEQGFAHEATAEEARAQEINEVLLSREAAEKKAPPPASSELDTLRRRLSALGSLLERLSSSAPAHGSTCAPSSGSDPTATRSETP